MTTEHLKINMNLGALWAKYLAHLQQLLDVICHLEAGSNAVTEEQVAEAKHFMSFSPHPKSKLSFDQAKEMSNDWLLRAFLRDSVEITGLFLDECLMVCSLIELSARGKSTSEELNHILNAQPLKNHKLHLPQKIEALQNRHGVISAAQDHVLSINKARACVVHRLGRVSPPDLDENEELKIRWRTQKVVAVGTKTGEEVVIDQPAVLKEESLLQIRFIDAEKSFKAGETVRLTVPELYACITTYFAFGSSLIKAIEDYANSLGVGPGHAEQA